MILRTSENSQKTNRSISGDPHQGWRKTSSCGVRHLGADSGQLCWWGAAFEREGGRQEIDSGLEHAYAVSSGEVGDEQVLLACNRTTAAGGAADAAATGVE